MLLILFLELLFRHVGGDGGKTIEADGIERAVLIASVGEEASCLKCHREPPEGIQHYSSLVIVYMKATDTYGIFIFDQPLRRRVVINGKSFGLCFDIWSAGIY
jgi:hypothetical protein